MPRYGAKTYGGKLQRKDEKNRQFDEVWSKNQGPKIAVPHFSPIKSSLVKPASRSNEAQPIGLREISPTRNYHTLSSPEEQDTNTSAPLCRRKRSNSSMDDPFSFGSDEELANSPLRKSSRPTHSITDEDQKHNSSLMGNNHLILLNQVSNPESNLSASSNSDYGKSLNGKKQASILKYAANVSISSTSDSEHNLTQEIVDRSKSPLDYGTATGLFTDGFGSPWVSSTSSLSNDVLVVSSPKISTPTRCTTQGLHSYAKSPDIKPAREKLFSVDRRTDEETKDFVIKRKSTISRTNGGAAANTISSKRIDGENFNVNDDKISNLKYKLNTSNDPLNIDKETSGQKMDDDSKDTYEFDFDDNLVDSTNCSPCSSSSRDSDSVTQPTSIMNNRSKGAIRITRRIFNSPKKSPMKARYNVRSWTTSDSLEISADSPELDDSQESIVSPASSTGVIKPPAPSTSNSMRVSVPPALTRAVKYPKKLNHSIVTSLKCQKQDKKYYTVIKHVKQALQCQESGESQQYSDDIEYLLDGLKSTLGSATRCLSTISLVEKSTVPSFRMHLRAHNTISRIFTALRNSSDDPCLALCTSGLMYMLSKDRLNMDLDRSSLTLLVQLLSMDSENTLKNRRPEEKVEYEKIRAKLWEVVKKAAQGNISNQLFGVDELTLSSGFFAMESLLSLTSKRAGEWFKEELRFAGGLEHMANSVATVTETVTAAHTDPAQIELVYLRTLNRCVRVLENVTFMNSDNQQYLLELSNLKLIKALASFLCLCEKRIEVCATDSEDTDGKGPNLAKLVIEGLLATLRLLLNLTHDNEWGSMKVGEQAGLMLTVLQCVLQLPQFIPKDQRFDLLVLSLGLLINLVEHSVTNTRILSSLKTNHSYDSQPDTDQTDTEGSINSDEVSSIAALTELFLLRERAAARLENQGEDEEDDEEIPQDAHNDIDDWVTVETEPIGNNSDGMQPTQEEIKQSIRRALHTAGRHMEDSIVASYAALLLGCLLRENKLHVKKVRDCLPNGDFSCMVHMLKKLLTFMELTDADGTTGQKSISTVIEVLECC